MTRQGRQRRTTSATPKPDALDLNTASAADLDTIPALQGHGFEIVRYREERGGFADLRQLNEVPGLTGKVDGLNDRLRIGAP